MKIRTLVYWLLWGVCCGLLGCSDSRECLSDVYFSESDLKIGDYYYSDGTWSDGGLRCIKDDGSYVIVDPKPAPITDKDPIGIVYSTDTDRIEEGIVTYLKEKGVDTVHGLVLSLSNLAMGKSYPWGGWNVLLGKDEEPSRKEIYSATDGFSTCQKYWSLKNCEEEYLPCWEVLKQSQSDSIGAKSTPWFIPSVGQWYDILCNLGGLKDSDPANFRESGLRGQVFWDRQGAICTYLNSWMQMIPASGKEEFNAQYEHYWTSTRFNRFRQYYVGIINDAGMVTIDWNSTGCKHKVRCILAF